jgi:hypothetical protein
VTACGRGKNNAKHLVLGERLSPKFDENGALIGTNTLPPDGPAEVAAGLAACISNECLPECATASVKPSTGSLVVQCTDLFMDTVWTPQVQGPGKTTVGVTEF